ncbi:hypothetical protein PN836_010265 [Ningiella sp. W23]|uniref:hypothetical protein n=1 Tax=Ningiella sp. W23 TaxID=3023715 RepID=UPI0037582EE2
MIKILFLVVLSASLLGCAFKIGENAVIISGQIDKTCTLRFKQIDAQDYDFQTRVINGNFAMDFTISPEPETYNLTVKCKQHVVVSKVIDLPAQKKLLNLGVVSSAQT